MKKYNVYKIVLICLALFLLLSWIFPAAYFQSSFVSQGRVQMGLFDIFSYPITALQYFGYIALYVLAVGAFYGVLHSIPAYRIVIDKIAKKFKDKSIILLSVIMVILALLTSICGLNIGLLLVFPFVISLVFAMKYDKIVALLTTVGSVCVGLMGTTLAYNNVNILASVLGKNVFNQIIPSIIILVLGLALLIFNTVRYIKNMSKNNKVSSEDMEYYLPSEVKAKEGKKVKIWPLVLVLDLMLLIVILSFIPWSDVFKLEIMDDALSAVTSFKLFGFPIFGKLLGNLTAFGTWTLTSLTTVVFVAALILALVYRVNFDTVCENIAKGAKRAIGPAFLVILIYTGLVIVTYHPFQLVIYKAILGLTKGFNVFTASVVAILSSFFNADMTYEINSSVPYLVSLVSDKSVYGIIWVLYQAMYGVTMLVAPTSVVLVTTLAYLNVSFKDWLKNSWKLVVELLVVSLIVLTILVII